MGLHVCPLLHLKQRVVEGRLALTKSWQPPLVPSYFCLPARHELRHPKHGIARRPPRTTASERLALRVSSRSRRLLVDSKRKEEEKKQVEV